MELVAQYLLLYSMSGDPGDFSDLVDYNYQRAKMRIMLKTTEQDHHKALYVNIRNYVDQNFPKDVKVEFGGDVMFWLAQVNYIVAGKIQNIVLAIIIVMLFCMLVFRSVIGGMLSVIPLAISSILTFGLMGFLGIRLETGTAIITAIGIGIGVDFAIHYILRMREECVKGLNLEEATRATLLTSGKAIIFDVISNIIGFIIFIFSGFIPLQNFGWLISFTMVTVAVGSLLVFPALFSLTRPNFLRQTNVFNQEEIAVNSRSHTAKKEEVIEVV